MAAFGWSAGDLFTLIQTVVKVVGALREIGGVKADYQEAFDFLFGLETTPQNLRSIAPILITPSQAGILQSHEVALLNVRREKNGLPNLSVSL
jgi:hypothetical protein